MKNSGLHWFRDMSLSKLWEVRRNMEAWSASVCGVTKSWTWPSNATATAAFPDKQRWSLLPADLPCRKSSRCPFRLKWKDMREYRQATGRNKDLRQRQNYGQVSKPALYFWLRLHFVFTIGSERRRHEQRSQTYVAVHKRVDVWSAATVWTREGWRRFGVQCVCVIEWRCRLLRDTVIDLGR